MIKIKTEEEIKIMAEGGKILKKVIDQVVDATKPGMTTRELDSMARKLIVENGGQTSFDKVKGYNWALCTPVNEEIVHTPPNDRKLVAGDVLCIDIGVFYKGFHTDYSTTFVVGGTDDQKIIKFLEVGKNTLEKAIEKVRVGNRIGDISQLIEKEIEGHGYCVVHELTGHGVGRSLHEDPYVYGYVEKPIEKTAKIEEGMVLAIEIIYSFTSSHIKYLDHDDWTLVTDDGSISACFERTVAVYKKCPFILT